MSQTAANMPKVPVPPYADRSRLGVLGWMLGLSLLLHILLAVAVKQGWIDAVLALPPVKVVPVVEEVVIPLPLTYVDVMEENATNDEVPDDTPFYGARSSVATNPDPVDTAGNVPRIDGTQQEMIRTETVPAPSNEVASQPASEAAPESPAAEPVQAPSAARPVGDLALVRPNETVELRETPVTETTQEVESNEQQTEAVQQSKPDRPRRLSEVRSRALAGNQMLLEGGVARYGSVSLFDVKGNVFGAYDEAMRIAVQDRWYSLLDRVSYAHRGGGRVTIKFTLHEDGRVTGGVVKRSNVDLKLGYYCLSAIEDPAPYAEWPDEMKRLIGSDRRELEFNFYYR